MLPKILKFYRFFKAEAEDFRPRFIKIFKAI